jgi:hypothetical protein
VGFLNKGLGDTQCRRGVQSFSHADANLTFWKMRAFFNKVQVVLLILHHGDRQGRQELWT